MRLGFRWVAVALVVAAFGGACSKSDNVDASNHDSHDNNSVTINNHNGGTLTGSGGAVGVVVTVPAGAVPSDVTITAASVASASAPALPAGVTALGSVFLLSPEGTKFTKPVSVTIPYAMQASTKKLFTASAGGAWAEVAGATDGGNAMTGQVTHFSYFVVVNDGMGAAGGGGAAGTTGTGGSSGMAAGGGAQAGGGGSAAGGAATCGTSKTAACQPEKLLDLPAGDYIASRATLAPNGDIYIPVGTGAKTGVLYRLPKGASTATPVATQPNGRVVGVATSSSDVFWTTVDADKTLYRAPMTDLGAGAPFLSSPDFESNGAAFFASDTHIVGGTGTHWRVYPIASPMAHFDLAIGTDTAFAFDATTHLLWSAVGGGGALHAVDVSSLSATSQPTVSVPLPMGETPIAVQVGKDGTAYLLTGSALWRLDVSASMLGKVTAVMGATDFVVAGDKAYLLESDGLHVVGTTVGVVAGLYATPVPIPQSGAVKLLTSDGFIWMIVGAPTQSSLWRVAY